MQPIIDSRRPSTSSPYLLGLLAPIGVSVLALGACDPGDDELDALDRMADSEALGEEAAALIDPASAPEPLSDDPPVLSRPQLDLTATPHVQAYLWKGWVSEEQPASTCGTGQLVSGFDCDGSKCDNVRIECNDFGGTLGESNWSKWISEESPNNFYQCPGNQYMSGVTCSGSYCDNLSLECTVTSFGKSGCTWAGPNEVTVHSSER